MSTVPVIQSFSTILKLAVVECIGDLLVSRAKLFVFQNGEYSISLKTSARLRHFKVSVLSSGQFGIGQRKFDSIDDLLEHYTKSPIFTSKQEKDYLTRPVRR